jgi:hypothetical protein
MCQIFVWNTTSFDQASDDSIFSQLQDALEGLIQIPNPNEVPSLYFDGTTPLLDRSISPSYSVSDFILNLQERNLGELAQIFLELEDKADAINELPEDVLIGIAETAYYFTSIGYLGSVDALALVAELDGILFSVKSCATWQSHEIEFSTYPPHIFDQKPSIVFSVCDVKTAKLIASSLVVVEEDVPLSVLLPNCKFTDSFLDWTNKLTIENVTILRQKLKHAHQRSFEGGKPLFDTLNDADGMREVRMKAHAGGAIRVLFGPLGDGDIALLRGFIKKSNAEGYKTNIAAALKDWSPLKLHKAMH